MAISNRIYSMMITPSHAENGVRVAFGMSAMPYVWLRIDIQLVLDYICVDMAP